MRPCAQGSTWSCATPEHHERPIFVVQGGRAGATLAGAGAGVVFALGRGGGRHETGPMGLLDFARRLLGRRLRLELTLDAEAVAGGDRVTGEVRLSTGRKPAGLEAVVVRLVRIVVHTDDGSARADIEREVVGEQTVAAHIELAPETEKRVKFSLDIPAASTPSDRASSYRVQARARRSDTTVLRASRKLEVVGLQRSP